MDLNLSEFPKYFVERDYFWVPVLLFLFTVTLKVCFAQSKVIGLTLRDVIFTLGTELCALAIAIHFGVIVKSDTNFILKCKEWFPHPNDHLKIGLLGLSALTGYFVITLISFLLLREAREERTPDDVKKRNRGFLLRSFFLAFSLGLGVTSMYLVILSIGRIY